MTCKKCGAESPENAVYCGICGSRVDGKKPCGNCGELNEETYTYCIHCGARIDGKTACGNCGEVHEGNFCPVCGYGERRKKSAATSAKVHNANLKEKKTDAWQTISKILGITGSGFAMLGVLFSLIFVFFIGVSIDLQVAGTNVGSSLLTQISTALGEETNIFYYFGKAFEDIKALGLNTLNVWDWQMDAAYRMTAILGLVIGILALVSVVTFATLATVVYVRNWLGYTEKKADKWALACMISLLASVGIFMALHYAKVTYTITYLETTLANVTVTGKSVANGSTSAAVVLVTICLALACVCKLVAAGKESLKSKNILKSVLALVGVGLAITVLCVSQNTGLALVTNYSASTSSAASSTINVSSGFLELAIFLLMNGQYDATSAAGKMKLLVEGFDKMLVLNMLAQVMVLLIVVFAVLSLASNVETLASERSRSGVVWAGLTLLFSVVLLVLAIIAKSNVADLLLAMEEQEMTVKMLGSVIVTLVFAVLNLLLAVVRCVLNVKEKKAGVIEF